MSAVELKLVAQASLLAIDQAGSSRTSRDACATLGEE